MSATGSEAAQWPNLKPWKPGQSGNPTGVSRYAKDLRAAINAQETPDRVCAVIDAMRMQALAGEKSSPSAAKVYLEAVGVKAEPVKVDLSQAPDEVVAWLAENVA